MKTSTLPATRVTRDLRQKIEKLLGPDESLSAFVELAVKQQAAWREEQAAFIDRGLTAESEDDWVSPDAVYRAIRLQARKRR